MSEPAKIRAGDTIKWSAAFSEYSAADGWSLSYVIVGSKGGITGIAGVANGAAWDITITATESKKLTKGNYYRLVGQVSKGVEKYTVYDEPIAVEADLMNIDTGSDIRTDEEVGLEAIKAVLAKRATKDQENYSIAGRSLSRTPIADLITLKNYYEREVAKQRKADALSKGQALKNKIKVRF